jgi:hypothetical protein
MAILPRLSNEVSVKKTRITFFSSTNRSEPSSPLHQLPRFTQRFPNLLLNPSLPIDLEFQTQLPAQSRLAGKSKTPHPADTSSYCRNLVSVSVTS